MDFIEEQLISLEKNSLYRELKVFQGEQNPYMSLRGQKILHFSANDYLGLATHASLKKASGEAVEKFGCGTGASRLLSGTTELHDLLEQEIASFKNTEDALLFNSGFSANLGLFSSLMNKNDVILCDKLNHASIIYGAQLSKATLKRYSHKDMKMLEKLLISCHPESNKLIVTDGLFSMDGDLAPLPDIIELAHRYNSMIMVDEAHGTGVFGQNGRGVSEFMEVEEHIDIHMGTLSKAVGSFGGYIAGSKKLKNILVNKAGSFIYTTSLPPAVLAASREAIKLIRNNFQGRKSLLEKSAYFRDSLNRNGFDTMESISQIIPILVGTAEQAIRMSQVLLKKGILIPAIRPPTVPVGKSRLRISLSTRHSLNDINKTINAIIETGKDVGVI